MTTARLASPGEALATPAGSWLICSGCGTRAPAGAPFTVRCPAARPGEDIDHVMTRRIDPALVPPHPDPDPNPFVRYRHRFHAWHVARAAGWSDERYVDLVRELDEAVAAVDGHGFRVTPVVRCRTLDERLGFGLDGGVWVKDETHNVSGSHKARHLMGVMLELRVAEAIGAADPRAPLAIASCGNAALAAAVVARAARRRLVVYVLPDAEPEVVARLRDLEAEVTLCEREPGQGGDPSVARLVAAVAEGAVPFTCQGDQDGLVIEGGATLGWELIDQLPDEASALDRVIVHVGGGAFASAVALAFDEALALGIVSRRPRFDTVQTTGAWPLARAYDRVLADLGLAPGQVADEAAVAQALATAAHHRSRYMWAWEVPPASIAHGIIDDETYDWLAVVRAMLVSGGRTVVVEEDTLREANALGTSVLGIDADHTGTAGLAGLMQLRRDGVVASDESVAIVFSGIRRQAGGPAGQPAEASTHAEAPAQGGNGNR